MNIEQFDWRKMKNVQKMHRFLYAIGLGPVVGKIILLLTTTGRKSGQPRITPLQYEMIDGKVHLGASRGLKADWVKNIEHDPHVKVQVKSLKFNGLAHVCTDPIEIADFLEVRLKHHPLMIGLIMQKAHGLPRKPSRMQLEVLALNEVMIVVTPLEG
jgi:deazaflavin-dependent oxidoreductase (nitroreductase family)